LIIIGHGSLFLEEATAKLKRVGTGPEAIAGGLNSTCDVPFFPSVEACFLTAMVLNNKNRLLRWFGAAFWFSALLAAPR
jgi:hypothetical protein